MGTASAAAGDVATRVTTEVSEDGRRRRRDRNRTATVDAMLELIHEGNLAPSSDDIAERAGLSPRSLFRYFDDLDDLQQAAIARHLERVRPTLDLAIEPGAALDTKIAALVDQRLRMFDAMGSVGRVARMRETFQPLIATQLKQFRSHLRRQIERLFAAELTAAGPAAASIVAAADVITSFEAYRLLRDDQKLSRARAGTVLTESLLRLLDPHQTHSTGAR